MSDVNFYNQNAEKLFEAYESLDPKVLFSNICQYMPRDADCLDIGCGSGRDAHWLEALGNKVIAIDPAEKLLALAKEKHGNNIKWIVSRLPCLEGLKPDSKFDFILVSAVWMHIPIKLRRPSLKKIKSLLKDNGSIVITIRSRGNEATRKFYYSSWRRLKNDFKACGLTISHKSNSKDNLGRRSVNWLTVALTHTPS
ncbi:MAG: class I SAM-dependent methyltransferase [Cellvibrionaceae bacterium]